MNNTPSFDKNASVSGIQDFLDKNPSLHDILQYVETEAQRVVAERRKPNQEAQR